MANSKESNEERKAHKRGEFLGDAYERFRVGKIEDGLSLLLVAAEEYDAKYNAVKVALDNAKRNGVSSRIF